MAIAVSISLKNGLTHVLGDGMGGEEEDDLLPLALVGEILSQRLSDVVREGLDEAGVRSPTVDEAPLHRRRAAADRRKGYGYVIVGLYCTYRDPLKGGPVLLSNSQEGPGRNFSQPRDHLLVEPCRS